MSDDFLRGIWNLLQTYITRHKDYQGFGFCEVYDVHYYKENGKFLDGKCSDPNCSYCSKRPNKHPKDCKCKEVS